MGSWHPGPQCAFLTHTAGQLLPFQCEPPSLGLSIRSQEWSQLPSLFSVSFTLVPFTLPPLSPTLLEPLELFPLLLSLQAHLCHTSGTPHTAVSDPAVPTGLSPVPSTHCLLPVRSLSGSLPCVLRHSACCSILSGAAGMACPRKQELLWDLG